MRLISLDDDMGEPYADVVEVFEDGSSRQGKCRYCGEPIRISVSVLDAVGGGPFQYECVCGTRYTFDTRWVN